MHNIGLMPIKSIKKALLSGGRIHRLLSAADHGLATNESEEGSE
jgi:hypothetical protein